MVLGSTEKRERSYDAVAAVGHFVGRQNAIRRIDTNMPEIYTEHRLKPICDAWEVVSEGENRFFSATFTLKPWSLEAAQKAVADIKKLEFQAEIVDQSIRISVKYW